VQRAHRRAARHGARCARRDCARLGSARLGVRVLSVRHPIRAAHWLRSRLGGWPAWPGGSPGGTGAAGTVATALTGFTDESDTSAASACSPHLNIPPDTVDLVNSARINVCLKSF
jgi:hypothetical protein